VGQGVEATVITTWRGGASCIGEGSLKKGGEGLILSAGGMNRKPESGIYWLTKLYRVRASESASDPVTSN